MAPELVHMPFIYREGDDVIFGRTFVALVSTPLYYD